MTVPLIGRQPRITAAGGADGVVFACRSAIREVVMASVSTATNIAIKLNPPDVAAHCVHPAAIA